MSILFMSLAVILIFIPLLVAIVCQRKYDRLTIFINKRILKNPSSNDRVALPDEVLAFFEYFFYKDLLNMAKVAVLFGCLNIVAMYMDSWGSEMAAVIILLCSFIVLCFGFKYLVDACILLYRILVVRFYLSQTK